LKKVGVKVKFGPTEIHSLNNKVQLFPVVEFPTPVELDVKLNIPVEDDSLNGIIIPVLDSLKKIPELLSLKKIPPPVLEKKNSPVELVTFISAESGLIDNKTIIPITAPTKRNEKDGNECIFFIEDKTPKKSK